ncbi:MAG: fructose-6-phosphate aldolase [Candidatus Levyibacteriota bacterium]|nr:MAG: fructose-6-phosphate aldolase [Candidatus Levybacteria bacterium]
MARQIFIDTANIEDIKFWKERGICDGITTNQKLFLTEKGVDFKRTIQQMCNFTKVPVSVELTGHESIEKMIKEAKMYAAWNKYIVIKVPMTPDGMGLTVLRKLKKLGIKTNATLMMSFEQMVLAIISGATYASIFYNRSKDAGYDPDEIIKRTRVFIDVGSYKSQIITGSIRDIRDVGNAFAAGSDIVTTPPKILDLMLKEEMTIKTMEEFDAAWEVFKKN